MGFIHSRQIERAKNQKFAVIRESNIESGNKIFAIVLPYRPIDRTTIMIYCRRLRRHPYLKPRPNLQVATHRGTYPGSTTSVHVGDHVLWKVSERPLLREDRKANLAHVIQLTVTDNSNLHDIISL
jgi:hypothetical protein